MPLCAPEALALRLHYCGNFQTQIGEPLRELSLEPLFCSSLLASPGPHILLSGFGFGLTVLSLTCQWPVFSLLSVTLLLISPLMSQHASSSSQTISSPSLNRGDRAYTVPHGFPTASVQAAVAVVRQYRKGEVSKAEAILDIQAALTSGEAEPSNEDLTNALASYITMLDDFNQSAREDQPRSASTRSLSHH